MSLLSQAEMFEKAGQLDEAIALYKQYASVTECMPPEMHYKIGMVMLGGCKEHFDQEVYQNGIDHLIEAYNRNYKDKESIYQLLYDIVYLPNVDILKSNFEKNCHINKIRLRGGYDQLPFLLFPLNNHDFRVYNCLTGKFFKKNEMMLEVAVYVPLIMDEAEIIEQFDFSMLLKRIQANSESQKILNKLDKAFTLDAVNDFTLDQIEQLKQLMPYSERYEWLLGKYYYLKQDYERAKSCVERGLTIRPLNKELNLLAAEVYWKLKHYSEAAAKYLFLSIDGNIEYWYTPKEYDFSDDYGKKFIECAEMAKKHSSSMNLLKLLNVQIKDMREFIARREFNISQTGKLEINRVFLLGKIVEKVSGLKYFSGLYAEYTKMGTCYDIVHTLLKAGNPIAAYRTTYDIIEAEVVDDFQYKPCDCAYLIPFMAKSQGQQMQFEYKNKEYNEVFGGLECNFLRIHEPLHIRSKTGFAVGQPIALRHDKSRKKVVINILIDYCSFVKMKENNFKLVPNIKKFFDKGIIFMENYTQSEWTLPGVSSIQTGLNQDRTKIFHPHLFVQMPTEYQTIAQYMREKGYYCMLLQAVLGSVRLCNAYRGFHRVIGNESLNGEVMIAYALQNLRALRETDVFMHLHMLDVHIPTGAEAVEQQVHLDMDVYMGSDLLESKSVCCEASVNNVLHYEEKLKQVDGVLASLFNYLENEYNDDEYIVMVHADHGSSLVGDESFRFKEGLANTPFMIRGANLPGCGLIDNEVTNSIDLYATLAHLCECEIRDDLDCCLPKVFGGKGREYSVSNSIYPGQTYKMSIYTLEYKFYLETAGYVSIDGKVNMQNFTYQLFRRDQEQKKIEDQALLLYFLKIVCDHTKRIHDPNL